MMKTLKSNFTLVILLLSMAFFQSCKDKSPSIAKIFVRSNSNELLTDARVVIIADLENNESNIEYVDTLNTNSSGYAEFNLKDYFEKVDKKVTVGTFNIICRKSGLEGFGKIRARINTTAVETVLLAQ